MWKNDNWPPWYDHIGTWTISLPSFRHTRTLIFLSFLGPDNYLPNFFQTRTIILPSFYHTRTIILPSFVKPGQFPSLHCQTPTIPIDCLCLTMYNYTHEYTIQRLNQFPTVFFLGVVCGYLRVCYYSNWSQYRPPGAAFGPEDIDPTLCSHIVYAFGKLDGEFLTASEWNDESTQAVQGK